MGFLSERTFDPLLRRRLALLQTLADVSLVMLVYRRGGIALFDALGFDILYGPFSSGKPLCRKPETGPDPVKHPVFCSDTTSTAAGDFEVAARSP